MHKVWCEYILLKMVEHSPFSENNEVVKALFHKKIAGLRDVAKEFHLFLDPRLANDAQGLEERIGDGTPDSRHGWSFYNPAEIDGRPGRGVMELLVPEQEPRTKMGIYIRSEAYFLDAKPYSIHRGAFELVSLFEDEDVYKERMERLGEKLHGSWNRMRRDMDRLPSIEAQRIALQRARKW